MQVQMETEHAEEDAHSSASISKYAAMLRWTHVTSMKRTARDRLKALIRSILIPLAWKKSDHSAVQTSSVERLSRVDISNTLADEST